MPNKNEIEKHKNSSASPILIGALVGAGAGLVAAMLLRRRATKKERESTLTITEGIKIGVLVFGLLRAIAALGDED
jgi:hypothetical protein